MRWTDIPFDPPRATLRQFAGLCLVVFGGMALWQALVRGHVGAGVILAILALTIGPLGLARPEWVRSIYVGWMIAVFPIGWLVSQVILAVMFYGLFVPTGLIFKLIGRDPMQRTRSTGLKSYWTPKTTPSDLSRYFKQF
jgi:hypothetical protein